MQLVDTQYAVHNFIRDRWSPYAFSCRSVEREKLLVLLEASRWAASSFNEQPWYFLLATQEMPDEYSRLLSCLTESNQSWAQQAPVLMLSIAKLRFDHHHKPNPHAIHDVGAAACSLTLQATALGLFVHQMAGFDADKARSLFQIPTDYEPVAAIAIGYLGNPQTLPEKYQQREAAPRTRKPLTEFVFTDDWGHPSAIVTN